MSDDPATLAIALFGELLTADQLLRAKLTRVLPKGMELSHFSVLNHLAHTGAERSPAQLAQVLHVTKGAMTNTLNRLEWTGYVHIRPDWDDARRKMVALSPAGRQARDQAVANMTPLIETLVTDLGTDRLRDALPILRDLRERLGRKD